MINIPAPQRICGLPQFLLKSLALPGFLYRDLAALGYQAVAKDWEACDF